MSLLHRRNLPENEQRAQTPPGADSQDYQADVAPHEIARLALSLMVELSTWLQLFTGDVTHGSDLEEVARRWVQRLMALVQMLERIAGKQHGPQSLHAIDTATSPHITLHSERSYMPDGHQDVKRRLSRRSLRLTLREREITELTKKGYPPRKIAQRLQLSVETVYTHLRNARRKQRLLDSLKSS